MRTTLIFLFSVITICSFAQNENEASKRQLINLPIPPSPNASALGKFGDIPVGLSTGIPSITIPFYSYSDPVKELSVLIGLNYHAGGHKVEDMASNCGLGWSLNAGGMVSRVIRGLPDDAIGGYINSPALPNLFTAGYNYIQPLSNFGPLYGITSSNSSDFYTVKDIIENRLDGEADIFQFSIGNVSGKFTLKKDGGIQFFTNTNAKITCNYSFNNSLKTIESFTITIDNGVQYLFNNKEGIFVTNTAATDPGSGIPGGTTSWYISKIISADKKDTVHFNYIIGNYVAYETGFAESRKIRHQSGILQQATNIGSYNYIENVHPLRLSSIDLPNDIKIYFYYNFSREDLVGDKALTAVYINGGDSEKRFNLNYSYFESDPTTTIWGSPNNLFKRLKLTEVQETDGVVSLPPYSFEYNSTKLPPRDSKMQDFWGYFNNKNNGVYIPAITTAEFGSIYGADRTVNEEATKAWILEKLYYPTGGHTRFYYSLNKGKHEGVLKDIGGLRVNATEDFEPVTSKILKTNYTYLLTDGSTSGEMHTLPNYSYYKTMMHHNVTGTGDSEWYEEYIHQTSSPNQSLSYFQGSPVIYKRIRVDKQINGISNGYSIHEFTSFTTAMNFVNDYPYVQKQDLEWCQGLPTKEFIYNSNNQIVKFIEKTYDYFDTYPQSSDTRNLVTSIYHYDNLGTLQEYIYGARAYHLLNGRAELKKITETEYVEGVPKLENITEYTYDADYLLKTKIKTTNSKGEIIEKRYYYPFQYTTTGLAVKTDLINSNRINKPVGEETWLHKNGSWYLKSATVNEYLSFAGISIKESKINKTEINNPLTEAAFGVFNPNILNRHSSIKEQVEITNYDDRGRMIEMRSPGEVYTSFIWGTGNEYPVALINNGRSDKTAYTSFELNRYGNWNLTSGSVILSNGGITGKKSLNGSVTKSVPSGNYTISAWAQGTITVNGQTVATSKQLGNWYFYIWKLVNASFVTVAGSNIDEVRLLPQDAEMTSYTFEPFKGITSQCDINNNITY